MKFGIGNSKSTEEEKQEQIRNKFQLKQRRLHEGEKKRKITVGLKQKDIHLIIFVPLIQISIQNQMLASAPFEFC